MNRWCYKLASLVTTFHDPFPHAGEDYKNQKKNYTRAVKRSKGVVLLNNIQLDDFCKFYSINPQKVLVNSLGVYDNIQCFIQKILKLKRYGYNLSICYMNSEFQLAEFLNYKKFFNGYGFDINLVSSVNLNNNYKLLKNFIDNNSISLYNNKDNGVIEKKNCNAGIDYACIDEFGNAYSCSVMKIKLGNIFNNNFNFLKEHINCNNICKIFENKY